MGFLSKIWKGIKKIAGVAAMIAAPFLAGPISAAIGISGALGSALTGAVVGGLGAAAAGVDPRIGMAIGGLGGFGLGAGKAAAAGGGGMFGGMFGGGATGAAGAGVASTAAPAAAGLTAAAAPAGAGGLFGTGMSLSQLAPLAMTMFGKAPQNLTEVEKQNLIANAETAATERGVFNQRLDAARSLLQQGQANPEQAYATAQMATQRGLRDAERTAGISERPGMQDATRRRAAIEGARIGTAAVTGEQARAAQTTAAGLSALPTDVPTSAPELNKTIYADLYKRRNDYAKDLSGAFGQAYGNIA